MSTYPLNPEACLYYSNGGSICLDNSVSMVVDRQLVATCISRNWIHYKYCFHTETLDTRLKKSKSLLEEALKHGFVECQTVVCLLVGVAGAGKTHTKHLLFRWAPPKYRNSIPLAARPVQAIRVRASTQGGQLKEVKPDQLDKIIAGTVAKGGVPLERKSFFQSLFCKCFYSQTIYQWRN